MPQRPAIIPQLDPSRLVASVQDRELFDRQLASFIPPEIYDVHAHLYPTDQGDVGFDQYARLTAAWMGDRAARRGLFFGSPTSPEIEKNNRFLTKECEQHDNCTGLLLVRPSDDPAAIEEKITTGQLAGFKVYHTYAARSDTPNADIHEYVPEWIWELAHRKSLAITLHMVKRRALADPKNQQELRDNLKRFPGCKLILAHAARGFCAQHTIEGISALAGFENVFFDTSAICEPGALVAILSQFGAGRLMFGSDFPVCNLRGRAVSIGDGFVWLYENNFDWKSSAYGAPTLVGIESLLALKQAAMFAKLTDSQVQAIFRDNARKLLGLV